MTFVDLNSVIRCWRQGKRQSLHPAREPRAGGKSGTFEALRQLAALEAILGPGRIRPETWNERSIYDDQQMLHFDSHQSSMPKFIKQPKYSDGFDAAANPMTIQQFSHGERLGALTLIYLELSLPLQVALRAAEAVSISSTCLNVPVF